MRTALPIIATVSLAGCALPTTVQRIAVEYNGAVAGMTNEVVLTNVLRAKERLPLHYTAISRATGAVTLKATSGFNAAVKADGVTDGISSSTTGQTASGLAPAGATSSTMSTVVGGITSMVARGANVYTPSVGGEVDTGPSFDVAILNDQKFYQGMLAPVLYSTVDTLVAEGFDEELVLRLLVGRMTFRLRKQDPGFRRRAVGEPILTIDNAARGPDARVMARTLACFQLPRSAAKPEAKVIASLSRFTRDAGGATRPLDLKDLALLDGKQFDLSGPIGPPERDGEVFVRRPGVQEAVPRLSARRGPFSDLGPTVPAPPSPRPAVPGECYVPVSLADPEPTVLIAGDAQSLPDGPAEDAVFTQAGRVYVPADGTGRPIQVEADIEVTFRSTEGVIRFVGDYLRAAEAEPAAVYRLGTRPLFTLATGAPAGALGSASIQGRRYYVPGNDAGRVAMQVVAIIEQLTNLQKSADAAPQTVPVRVVPGG